MVRKRYNPTLQDRVILELYKSGKELTIKELIRSTQLTIYQVHQAVQNIDNRRFVSIRHEDTIAKRRVPPQRILHIKIKNIPKTQEYLSGRNLI